MSHDRYDYGAIHEDDIDMSQPARAPTPFQTTRTCNMVASVYGSTDEVPPMTLDRDYVLRLIAAVAFVTSFLVR